MVKLIIEDDEGKTTVVPLIRDEITIGRKEGNTIRLTERNVSRRHAKLVKQNGAIFIEDLNSYNGIKVNGNRIAGRVAVTEGDRIQIGDYVLGLKLEGLVEAAAAAGMGAVAASASAIDSESARTMELPRPDEAPTAQIDVNEAAAKIAELDALSARSPAVAPAPAPRADVPGRLVCVSTNFPGKEWLLDKALVVIGRTDENDVVVNHRSISRHHARIVEENGRYTIVDLESSNGVRVNGEEYGKVELRRGDLIDLGHVRLRFVAPGEDFVFARDASVVDISKGGGGRTGIWIAVAAVLLVAAGFAVWRFGFTSSVGAGSGSDHGSGGTAQPGHGSGTGDGDQTQKVAELRGLGEQEQWAAIIAICRSLTGEHKTRAATDCARAQKEKAAKELFDSADRANMQRQWSEVLRLRKLIPDDSVYKNRDLRMVEKARESHLSKLRVELGDALKSKECDTASEVASKIKEADPADKEAEEQAKGCRAVAVHDPGEKKTPKKVPKKIVVVTPKVPPKKVEPTVNQAQVQQLVDQMNKAFVGGAHAKTIQLARNVLQLQPSNMDAVRALGAASCYTKQQASARWAYEQLRAGYHRNALKDLCQRNGVTVP
jgi:pSer/pThr/pTyr-binding forkhead associated (FHA) protein